MTDQRLGYLRTICHRRTGTLDGGSHRTLSPPGNSSQGRPLESIDPSTRIRDDSRDAPGQRGRRAVAFEASVKLPSILRKGYRRGLALRRDFVDVPRTRRVVLEEIDGVPIVVLPGVLNPARVKTGAVLASVLDQALIPRGSEVLDLGTGSGVIALFAARLARTVSASDLDPVAVRNARINVLLSHLEDIVDVNEGDLFRPHVGREFDVVLFNPPYFVGNPRSSADRAWRSLDVLPRFASELRGHLRPGGHALVVWSSDADASVIRGPLAAAELSVETVFEKDLINEIVTIWRIRRI